jgi:hypothetical protein
MKAKLTWKDLVYIGTIIAGIVLFFRDESKDRAEEKVIVKQHTEELKKINAKLEKHGEYWLEQKEVNGAVITALGIE